MGVISCLECMIWPWTVIKHLLVCALNAGWESSCFLCWQKYTESWMEFGKRGRKGEIPLMSLSVLLDDSAKLNPNLQACFQMDSSWLKPIKRVCRVCLLLLFSLIQLCVRVKRNSESNTMCYKRMVMIFADCKQLYKSGQATAQ